MAQDYVYVLMDPASNQVTTYGVGLHYLKEAMNKLPRNLVILSPNTTIGTFDDYTRFQIIRGEKSVGDFIDQQASLSEPTIKWVDYDSQELFHQLTPGEIAELLYLAHAQTHWHSPFFYKLQNNYVCLPLGNGMVKMYFRYINEFYYQLASVLRAKLQSRKVTRRSFFSVKNNAIEVALPTMEFMQSIHLLFNEGIVFDFNSMKEDDKINTLPVYLAEDNFEGVLSSTKQKRTIGFLKYDEESETWSLESQYAKETFGG